MNDSLCPGPDTRPGPCFSARLCRAAICLAVMGCLLLASANANAAPAGGCDPKVLTAQTALALARVAADKAMDDEINGEMPSSVLDLTCFDQAAAFSAQKAGKIFSGDFSNNAGFKAVLNDSLKSMESNFTQSLVSKKGLYAVQNVEDIASGGGGFNCDVISKLWGTVNNSGVKMNAPFPSFNDLMGGAGAPAAPAATPPTNAADPARGAAPASNYAQSWSSSGSQSAFLNLNAAMVPIKTAATPSFRKNKGTGMPLNTPCLVMQQAMPTVTCP